MKISVVTVNFNNREGLQKTAASVVGQTFRDFEWIVVDGGSDDGSKEVIERYADRIAWWCSEPDRGIYDAMNKGIAHSSGEYLLFLNSADMLFDENVLSAVIPHLQGKDFYIGDEMRGNHRVRPRVETPQQICRALLCGGFLPHQSTFVNRRIFEVYGPYRDDKKYVSDWWMFFVSLVLGDATVGKLPVITTLFDMDGLSSFYREKMQAEVHALLSEHPRAQFLVDFYKENSDIVESLRDSRIGFFLFRVYFWIYRKLRNK